MKRLLLLLVIASVMITLVSAAATLTDGYKETGWGVEITYPGKWTGTISVDTQLTQINGDGNKSYTVTGGRSINSQIIKADGKEDTLILSIQNDGKIIDSDKIYGTVGEAMVSAIMSDSLYSVNNSVNSPSV
jgi:hypothetical protein